MKKRLLFLLVAFGLCVTTIAQNQTTDTSATCVAYWQKNDSKIFLVTHRKERPIDGELTPRSVVTYEAHVRVTDATEEGYTIEWVQKNYRAEGTDEQTLSVTKALMEDVKMIYTTDDVGAFKELLNWEEVRDFWISMAALSVKKEDKDAVAAFEKVKAMFQSRESVESVIIREIQLYHMPYGVEYSKSGQTATTLLPNITGGEPFPATITLRLETINSMKDQCSLKVVQELDKEKGRTILISMLKKILPVVLKSDEIEMEIKNLTMTDINEYDVVLSSGWLSKASVKRVVNIGAVSQTEIYKIEEKK